MTTDNKLLPGDSAAALVQLLNQAGERMCEAGMMLSRLYAADPTIIDTVCEDNPGIPRGLLTALLRVGNKSLRHELLLNDCSAFRKLRLLPYAMQEFALKASAVDLVVDAETGDALRVPLIQLDAKQATQVISRDGLRTKDEQRAWIRLNRPAPKPAKADESAWFVKRGKLVITRSCELSHAQLLACLGEMAA